MISKEFNICAKMFAMENFGEWLLNELEKRNMSQSDLAKLSGLSRGTLSNLISGTRGLGTDSINAIARALKLPPAQVFEAAGILPANKDVDPWVEQMNVLLNSIKDPKSRGIAEKLLDSLATNEEETASARVQSKKAKGHA